MNAKNMTKALHAKMDDWLKHIEDDEVKKTIKDDAIITGGALVSLLNGEQPNDYDIYFKSHAACLRVAGYYADIWNKTHDPSAHVDILDNGGRISVYIGSVVHDRQGIHTFAKEEGESGIDDETEPDVGESEEEAKKEKPKYRPRYFTTNAISLSDKIQLIIRFYGSVEEIHSNYDFVHCTCSYDFKENKVNLPARALEAIINKELYYTGSKYPLCSIIRTRKFIGRGWNINAGQYVKMCLQLNELDLKNLEVFKDQLVGVDSLYFMEAINAIQKRQEEDPDFKVDNTYLFEVINRIF